MFTNTLRRMPLWQVALAMLAGFALMFLSSLIRFGHPYYIADVLAIMSLVLIVVPAIVAAYGYVLPALLRVFGLR